METIAGSVLFAFNAPSFIAAGAIAKRGRQYRRN